MAIDILPAASLALALIVAGGIVYLWYRWRDRTLKQLRAFADSLPADERVIFWRLYQHRDLWNASRYPKAFRKWRRQPVHASRTLAPLS